MKLKINRCESGVYTISSLLFFFSALKHHHTTPRLPMKLYTYTIYTNSPKKPNTTFSTRRRTQIHTQKTHMRPVKRFFEIFQLYINGCLCFRERVHVRIQQSHVRIICSCVHIYIRSHAYIGYYALVLNRNNHHNVSKNAP